MNARKGPARNRLPITMTMMNRIRAALAMDTQLPESGSVGSLLCGIFGFLRCRAFVARDSGPFDLQVHLCMVALVYVHNETHNHIEVQIKASKTDQYRQGTRVALGATGASICPVSALLDYLTIRGNCPGALFVNENGSPMRRGQFVLKVPQASQQTEVIGHHFNGHSFRIGAATSASQALRP